MKLEDLGGVWSGGGLDRRMAESWYVLRSKPQKESVLSRYARSTGNEVFYPTIPVKRVNPRARKVRPFFPGYMFVRTDLTARGESSFQWMPYSQGLVEFGGEPARVADQVIRTIQKRVAGIWDKGGLISDGLKKGDRVVVREGVFEGYKGIFDARLPGSERVRILLEMLSHRLVEVDVDAALIDKVVA